MRWVLPIVLILLPVACAPEMPVGAPELAMSFESLPSPPRCRTTPDGGPVLIAERGIGGTGGVTPPPALPPAEPANLPAGSRGVGGTGLGSIGVAGVITGFGSVCLNGLEVTLPPQPHVTVDGTAGTETMLRVGQRAILTAFWHADAPETDAIAIRHEVVGQVDGVVAPDRIIVAGQPVLLSMLAPLPVLPKLGDWLAVSGIRSPQGDILASRLDPASPGETLLHGRVSGTRAAPRIAGLSLSVADDALQLGEDVTVRGYRDDGILVVVSLTPDLLTRDPAAYFGQAVDRLSIESVVPADGRGLSRSGFAAEVSGQGPAQGFGLGATSHAMPAEGYGSRATLGRAASGQARQ